MSLDLQTVVDSLNTNLPDSVLDVKTFRGETTLIIDKKRVREVCSHLKNDFGFKFIADITAVDYLGVKIPRFEVVYHVHRFGPSFDDNVRIRLKTELPEEEPRIDSVVPVWSGANWLEREVYDMFGIVFLGHPDLRRILMPEDYEPHPLRKDFDVRDREASKRSFKRALEEGSE
ncbi:MAG TPA: NADH-quinone oxidoreductase subunit C [Thermodesulfobacteriota bacterium]|nr:NADH-quinone oxidoreductase subunit C [Thermodesulfobacteriota bacterium]